MGTRGITAVVKDGAFKISQYGQWDHYPEGQGADILTFLRDTENVEKLRSNVDNLREATQDDLDRINAEAGIPKGTEWITMEQARKRTEIAPAMSRDTGSKILGLVASGSVDLVSLDLGFVNDSLYCEYAYVIDLDTDTFEAYIGFQTKPHQKGRFAKRKPRGWTPKYAGESYYYPVALQASYPLDALPTQEQFEDDMLTEEQRKERAEEEVSAE